MMTVKTGNNTITLKFYYDAEGTPFYFDYNGTKYFYITNLQGDVVGIANSYGIVGYYEYDAWGRKLSINSASSNEYSALTYNPLRYRGYIISLELRRLEQDCYREGKLRYGYQADTGR